MEQEFAEIDKNGNWPTLYQDIRHQASDFPCKVAKLPENRNRNRYRDVSPFDHSRIKLQQGDNDYVNASLIKMEEAQRSYILTQGPLPNTCGHFWEMVWEQKSRGVVMLNRVIEKGSVKCARYWPSKEEVDMIFADTKFKLTLISEDVKSYYTVRQLEVENLAMDKRKDPLSVNVKQVLLEMRKYRMGLIQTADQMRFSYMAIIEGAKFIMGDSSVQEQWKELSNEDLDPPPEHSPPPPRPPKRATETPNGKTPDHRICFTDPDERTCKESMEEIHDGMKNQLTRPRVESSEPELRKRHIGESGSVPTQTSEQINSARSEEVEEVVEEKDSWLHWKPFVVNVCVVTAFAAGAYLCYKACFH
ncbi:tyrosine-protein phosphatase non-receptor type 1-like isoform X2 [Mustelus asterias]